MDNTTSWLNFAQQPVDQGGLGLAPHQASGLVGNLVNESGQALNPWGPTGDNGTAMGTAQWRGDRLQGLKDFAANNGLDHRDIGTQQQFMRHEMLGSENPAYRALLAAKTPEDAAAAFDGRYERSDGSTRTQRQNSARQLMAQFGGAGGAAPAGAGPGALGFANEADADATDPDPSAPTAGILSVDNTVGNGALSKRVMNGDGGDSKVDTVSQAMLGIAAALASVSNPQQAYALNQQLQAMKKDNKSKYKISVTKDGRIVRVDDEGNVDAVGGNPAAAAGAQAPQMLPVWGDPKLLGADPANMTPDQKESYLASMQGGQGELVRGILENRLPITAAAFTRKDSPYPAAFAAAAKIDPTVDPTVYAARQKGQGFWSTTGATNAQRLNQTIAHQSDVLVDSMKGLNNTSVPLWNDVKNWAGEHIAGQGAVPGFRTSAHAVVDELGKVFKQNNLSDAEIRKWEENLPDNMSPEQQRTQIGQFRKLMGGAMDAMSEARKQSIGEWAHNKARPLLSEEGAAGLKKLEAFAASKPESTFLGGGGATAPAKRPPLNTLIPLNQ